MDTIVALHQQMPTLETFADIERMAKDISALYAQLREKRIAWIKAQEVSSPKRRGRPSRVALA